MHVVQYGFFVSFVSSQARHPSEHFYEQDLAVLS